MAAYIFLRWVLVVIYSSQIRHFREIMQLPTLQNSCFDRFLTVLSAAVRACKTQDARRMNYWSPYLDCTAALTRKCNARFALLAYTRQTVRVRTKMGIP